MDIHTEYNIGDTLWYYGGKEEYHYIIIKQIRICEDSSIYYLGYKNEGDEYVKINGNHEIFSVGRTKEECEKEHVLKRYSHLFKNNSKTLK